MALVLSETGNSIAICLNAVAVLFLVEVDNLAFSHGLDEDLRREAEEFGRILLTDTEARILDAIKRVCALGVPGVILGGVGESNPWIIVGVCAPLPCMVVALVQSTLERRTGGGDSPGDLPGGCSAGSCSTSCSSCCRWRRS